MGHALGNRFRRRWYASCDQIQKLAQDTSIHGKTTRRYARTTNNEIGQLLDAKQLAKARKLWV